MSHVGASDDSSKVKVDQKLKNHKNRKKKNFRIFPVIFVILPVFDFYRSFDWSQTVATVMLTHSNGYPYFSPGN